ncbi:MAG: site-2 protease family protein, partial [Planctomycetota bacterium]|nr:site-2 protease family protein [Planctomycetota bacterium]
MEILAVSELGIWGEYILPILLLVLGLSMVIFVHELGHFMVAKLVGIKVERFALGFGKRVFGFRKGETDYCFNLFPLGGYIKMLGQEDVAPLTEQADPRAFNNKSVGARFAVISAGVIMNVIFAAILYVVLGLTGIRFEAPVVGGVVPGSPAASAKVDFGLQASTRQAPAT